jgi:hypothetical protein
MLSLLAEIVKRVESNDDSSNVMTMMSIENQASNFFVVCYHCWSEMEPLGDSERV